MENKAWNVLLEKMIYNSPITHASMFPHISEAIKSSSDPGQRELPDCNTWGKIHPADEKKTLEGIKKMLIGVSTSPCEFRMIQPDGSLRYISLMIKKVQDKS